MPPPPKNDPKRRSSQRVKQNQNLRFDADSSDLSDKDTENIKMTSRQKQIRLMKEGDVNRAYNKSVNANGNTNGNSYENNTSGSLQIKLKIPPRAQPQVEIKLPKDMDPEPVCPICLKIIIGDIDDINEHVDECIGPSVSNTSTLINSGICTPPDLSTRSTGSIINVDGDDFGYGRAQYSEIDIENIIKADNKNKSSSNHRLDEQEAKNSLLIKGILSASAPNPDFLSLQVALKSLLDRIASAPKCAVCWETLKMPAVVSVNCWHCCCEGCWLRTLGTKRLCPHCSTITNPSDLRKVFF